MSAHDYLEVATPNGRILEVLAAGPEDGFPLFFHSGTPSAAVPYPPLHEVLFDLGLRMITCSRPGYGESTPRAFSETGPRITDDLADTVTILDHLGIDSFVTLGWSGGGPRALGCAAWLPDRCLAATTLAGVAPYDAEGLDWSAGMGPENVEDFRKATEGASAYHSHLAETMTPIFDATADQLVEAFGELLTPVDAAALTGEYAKYLSRVFHRSGTQGVVGSRDDGLSLVAPWGFDVADIRVPVAVWQGRQDAMVPYAHGEWLAAHVPGARAHLLENEGHLTFFTQLDRILADLKDLAGLA